MKAIQRHNKIFVDLGEKILVISPHTIEEFQTARGKIKGIQERMRASVALHFRRHLVEILANLRMNVSVSAAGDFSDAVFEKEFRSLLRDAIAVGGQHGLNKVHAMQKQAQVFLEEDPNVLRWINASAGNKIKNLDKFSTQQARAVIHAGVERGATARDIGVDLQKKFGGWAAVRPGIQSRADMIARTETATAMNVGTTFGYEQSGVVNKVEVIDDEVARSCAICEEKNGQVWDLAKAQDEPLEHPNCTRAFSPVIMTEEEMIPTQETDSLSSDEQKKANEKLDTLKDKFQYNPISRQQEIRLKDLGWRDDIPASIVGINKTPDQLKKYLVKSRMRFTTMARSQSAVPIEGLRAYIANYPKGLPEIVKTPDGVSRVFAGHTRLSVQHLAGRKEILVNTFKVDKRGRVIR